MAITVDMQFLLIKHGLRCSDLGKTHIGVVLCSLELEVGVYGAALLVIFYNLTAEKHCSKNMTISESNGSRMFGLKFPTSFLNLGN